MAETIRKLLITGAAGTLGNILREGLKPYAASIRLSDINPLAKPAGKNEEYLRCDLADRDQVSEMVTGVDAIVHMGGAAHEGHFEPILQSNLVGVFNLYDAALAHGIKRIVLASSNHLTGYYPSNETVSADMVSRPDSLYAVSKGFGETLSSFFYYRHGIETVCLRIGSCLPRPKSQRCLAAWLSYEDFIELTRCSLLAPDVGHLIVYGVSNNPVKWWQDEAAERIGYLPKDSAANHLDVIAPQLPADDVRRMWQGGNILLRDYREGGEPPKNAKSGK